MSSSAVTEAPGPTWRQLLPTFQPTAGRFGRWTELHVGSTQTSLPYRPDRVTTLHTLAQSPYHILVLSFSLRTIALFHLYIKAISLLSVLSHNYSRLDRKLAARSKAILGDIEDIRTW